jgi:hypothetical protein
MPLAELGSSDYLAFELVRVVGKLLALGEGFVSAAQR